MTEPIYLDWNATAPVRGPVAAAVADAMRTHGNASSVHQAGRRARRAVEDSREAVAALAGADPRQVIFTSGGTEANNLAVVGRQADTLIVSGIEHASVLEAANGAISVPGTVHGTVDLERLARALEGAPGPVLVAVMLANNETGVVQPVAKVKDLVHEAGGWFHCDAVQAAGRMDIDFAGLGADSLSLSAHKIGGPMGVGALIVADGADLEPLIKGGGQERSRRAGTENVPAIVGFGVAAKLAADWQGDMGSVGALRDRLEARISGVAPDAVIYGRGADRLANTSLIGLPGVASDSQVMNLDLAGIAVSAGSACSSGKVSPSHVLAAMGIDETAANEAIRVSLGIATVAADIDRFVEVWARMRPSASVSNAA